MSIKPACSGNENDGVASNDEGDENDGVGSDNEDDENDEVASNDESDENKGGTKRNKSTKSISNEESKYEEDIDKEGVKLSETQETDTNEEKKKTIRNIQTRKSERIRKQRYVINPEDIGNNDDEDDQDYK